ncbi:unnamed protein product, partial [Ectocarpus sp. 13 AM-2016]
MLVQPGSSAELESPRVVEEIMMNLGGKQMSHAEHVRSRVPERHLTLIATREVDGVRQSFMNEEIMAASAHMGLDCITTVEGVRLVVGDTEMVDVPAFGSSPLPCRIASLFWQNKHSSSTSREETMRGGDEEEEKEEEESGHLVVRVSPFLGREHMPQEIKNKRRADDDDLSSVWEVTN